MRKFLIPVLVIVAVIFFFISRKETPTAVERGPTPESVANEATLPTVKSPTAPETVPPEPVQVIPRPSAPQAQVKNVTQKLAPASKDDELVLPYILDDGLAVIQGDIVLGQPDSAAESGFAAVPPLRLWPTTRIAYHIQATLPNPERVREALTFFEGTAIQFVPYTDEKDVLVFEPGNGICKSYVGWIGGKQPIWLPPNCSSSEVAHEILHALGFVHEQNRADRDQFIQMHEDGIEEKYKANFEKLPPDFMKISGLSPFDFESLMLYPDWMFAKNGRRTMDSKVQGRAILPRETPSPADLERLNRAYSTVPPSEPRP